MIQADCSHRDETVSDSDSDSGLFREVFRLIVLTL
jgi:hypothetical protein